MTRFVATVEYKGTAYAGWQSQKNQRSIQQAINQALSQVANHPINVVAAGRTDKGVHALQQVIHFDSSSERSEYNWTTGANTNLPEDIKVLQLQQTTDKFHARHSADYRRYLYAIYNHPTAPALLKPFCHWQRRYLDVQAMAEAGTHLLGRHDFAGFRSSDCQAKSSIRTVTKALIQEKKPWIIFDIQAQAFLHKMVRMIVAQLIAIGKNQATANSIITLLANGEREHKPVANPCGLFLAEVGYPQSWKIPVVDTKQLWLYKLMS